MIKYRKDGKIDLRYLTDDDKDARQELRQELADKGIEIRTFLKGGRAIVNGEDNQGRGIYHARNLKEYVGDIRKIETLEKKVNHKREMYQLDGYKTKSLNTLIREESDADAKITGTKNYIATLEKILNKHGNPLKDGMNKLDIAYQNQRALQKIKVDALGGMEKVAQVAGLDLKKFLKKDGTPKSKKLDRQLYRDLSKHAVDEDYVNSPDMFYPWLAKQNIKISDTDPETLKELYRDYATEKLKDMLATKQLGAREADNMKFNESEIVDRLELLGVDTSKMKVAEEYEVPDEEEDE